jgi:hypothetical protein
MLRHGYIFLNQILEDFGRLYPDAIHNFLTVFDAKIVPAVEVLCSSSTSPVLRAVHSEKDQMPIGSVHSLH